MFALFYMGWNSALAVGGFTFERIDLLITLLAAAVTLMVLRAVALRVRDVLLNRSLMWCYAVLLAIGCPHEIAHGSLRLSLSEETTMADADFVVDQLKEIIPRLRSMSPLYADFIAKK